MNGLPEIAAEMAVTDMQISMIRQHIEWCGRFSEELRQLREKWERADSAGDAA